MQLAQFTGSRRQPGLAIPREAADQYKRCHLSAYVLWRISEVPTAVVASRLRRQNGLRL